jgi:hypothetical protein
VVLEPGQTIPAGTIFYIWIDEGITYEMQAGLNGNPGQGVFGELLDFGIKG